MQMMIKNTTLTFLILTGMLLSRSSADCERHYKQAGCESEPGCVWAWNREGGRCFDVHPVEKEALLSLEAAADKPNYRHQLPHAKDSANIHIHSGSSSGSIRPNLHG